MTFLWNKRQFIIGRKSILECFRPYIPVWNIYFIFSVTDHVGISLQRLTGFNKILNPFSFIAASPGLINQIFSSATGSLFFINPNAFFEYPFA